MPSPFPGMDPWLEGPQHWHVLHKMLILEIAKALNETLPEGLAAIPDVAVIQRHRFAIAPNRQPGGVATATPAVEVVSPAEEEIRLPYLQVIGIHSPRKVLAMIEILSPINKTGEGREKYLQKQREILDSSAHLLEIDLLRGGKHTVAVAESALLDTHMAFWDYLVCLHQAGAGERFSVWPFTLRDFLPVVRLPLEEPFPDQLIDLPTLFTACYDAGPFRRTLDYSLPPEPRLKRSDADWAAELLS